jgi:hypothetical protein
MIPDDQPNHTDENTPVPSKPGPTEPTKPPVDWWNKYVVTSAVGFLALIALYWLVVTYLLPQLK